jgi:hypothetical protein
MVIVGYLSPALKRGVNESFADMVVFKLCPTEN